MREEWQTADKLCIKQHSGFNNLRYLQAYLLWETCRGTLSNVAALIRRTQNTPAHTDMGALKIHEEAHGLGLTRIHTDTESAGIWLGCCAKSGINRTISFFLSFFLIWLFFFFCSVCDDVHHFQIVDLTGTGNVWQSHHLCETLVGPDTLEKSHISLVPLIGLLRVSWMCELNSVSDTCYGNEEIGRCLKLAGYWKQWPGPLWPCFGIKANQYHIWSDGAFYSCLNATDVL